MKAEFKLKLKSLIRTSCRDFFPKNINNETNRRESTERIYFNERVNIFSTKNIFKNN